MIKKKTSITVDTELKYLFTKRFKSAGFNFSAAIEGLMLAAIKDPRPYWKVQAKIHKLKFDNAIRILAALEDTLDPEKAEKAAKKAREEVMFQ